MRFVPHMSVARKGRPATDFCVTMTEADVRAYVATHSSRKPATWLEYMACDDPQRRVTKLYLDRDEWLSSDAVPSADLVAERELTVREHVAELLAGLSGPDRQLTYVLATRHGVPNPSATDKTAGGGRYKLSFRAFMQGIRVRFDQIPLILSHFGQTAFWDMSPYKAHDQLLGAIYCCKGPTGGNPGYNDRRPLVPARGEAPDPLLYIAQHTDDAWDMLDLPDDFGAHGKPAEERTARKSRSKPPAAAAVARSPSPQACLAVDPPVDVAFVQDLLAGLDPAAVEDRDRWITAGMALHYHGRGTDAYFDAWVQWSRRSATKFMGVADCRTNWSSFKYPMTGPTNFGTLCKMARDHDPAAYAAARRKRTALEATSPAAFAFCSDGVEEAGETPRGTWDPTLYTAALQVLLPALEADPTFTFTPTHIEFKTPSYKGRMCRQDKGVSITAGDPPPHKTDTVSQEQERERFVGFLGPAVSIKECAIRVLDSRIPKIDGAWDVGWTPERTGALMTCSSAGSSIEWMHALKTGACLEVRVPGQRLLRLTSKKHMTGVDRVYLDALDRNLLTGYGIKAAMFVGCEINTVNVVNVHGHAGDDPDDFLVLRDVLLRYAVARRLRKVGSAKEAKDGLVMEPVAGCPCAFTQRCTYAQFINEALRHEAKFHRAHRNYDNVLQYIHKYTCLAELPEYVVDVDLLSFSNGVVELSTGTFTPYMGMAEAMSQRVARHHIGHPYTGQVHTPLLDTVLEFQFGRDVAEVVVALVLGRVMFKVGQLDNWQVMPYLVGLAGTGKGVLMSTMSALFEAGRVGTLAVKREEIFGQANLLGKDVIMGMDMPEALSTVLPQEALQTMVSGELMEVARKFEGAVNMVWTTPFVLGSNHMPDYVNTGNNIGRRLVSLRFDRMVDNKKDGLLRAILDTELPNVVCRALRAYADLRQHVADVGLGFWKAVPPQLLQWQGQLAAATNALHEFLQMDDGERGCSITVQPGRITWLTELQDAFRMAMPNSKFKADAAVLHQFGFSQSSQPESVCMSCKQLATSRGGKCCGMYSNKERRNKQVIHNMQLTPNSGQTAQPQNDAQPVAGDR